ncbi:DUF3597 domain-containing protein [Mesorhizobium sp. ES1-1]|uniref:DUF3597 domain-containing protein n=1 Tax=Mesorhizobium sp. ES1-1 TaxID=2876629 RepID=UPI001CCDC22B|nr:DUF3597 domain-containing protein [Mesorhizobium sp. ES1-1]MBZ9677880.1 DUF3597 domain-containing protein [Mesorhizobium sp. ES1-1]
MSVFDKIKDAIFGKAEAAEAPGSATPTAPAPSAPPAAPSSTAGAAPKPTVSAPPSQSATSAVDVSAVMDAAVKASGERLNWRTSIVDMMKALNLDSSLANRKELAKELQYTGDTSDSAKMNVWLHKALLQKLAANGGKVPADLTD